MYTDLNLFNMTPAIRILSTAIMKVTAIKRNTSFQVRPTPSSF